MFRSIVSKLNNGIVRSCGRVIKETTQLNCVLEVLSTFNAKASIYVLDLGLRSQTRIWFPKSSQIAEKLCSGWIAFLTRVLKMTANSFVSSSPWGYLQAVCHNMIQNIFNFYHLPKYRCNNIRESNKAWSSFTGRFRRKAYLLCLKK